MSTRRRYGIAALSAATGLALAGCGVEAQGADAAVAEVASVAVPADGGPGIVTLSEAAEERLGVATAAVTAAPSGLVVPYAAVVYEADGSSWVFVRTEPSTYRRAAIAISGITGDQVALASGPPAGTEVVTVGAAELVGVEIGIDGEE
jgi:hypothetical protein